MPAQYDPTIIASFAERLYVQAGRIIFMFAALGGLVSCIGGGVLGSLMGGHSDGSSFAMVGALALGAAGAWLGYSFGRERAFELKLRAQTALCQLQIELNTRR